MTEVTIADGETKEIVPSDQAAREYFIRVRGADVRLGHSQRYARDGTQATAGDRLTYDPEGKPVWAYAEGGQVTLELDENNGVATFQPRTSTVQIDRLDTLNELQDFTGDAQATLDALETAIYSYQNATGYGSQSVTGSGSFASATIPDGGSVTIRAHPDNVDTISLGDFVLLAGESVELRIDDVGDVSVTAADGSDETLAIYEVVV